MAETEPLKEENIPSDLPSDLEEIGQRNPTAEQGPVEELKIPEKPEQQPEQIERKEEKKQTDEEKKTAVQAAKTELRGLLTDINEAREIKQRETERSCYIMAEKPYNEVTGEGLELAARKISQAEARQEGQIVMSRKDYLNEGNLMRIQEKIKQKEQLQAVKPLWDMLPENEKQKYDNDFNKYVEAKRQNLADMAGFPLSKEAFSEMVKRGLNPEGIKKTGWFFKKIKISFLDGRESVKMSKKEFENWGRQLRKQVEESTGVAAQEELNRIVHEGARRAAERRERHMRELIQVAAKEEEPKIDVAQKELEERFQQLSELRKIKKDLPEVLEDLVNKRKMITHKYEEGKRITKHKGKLEPLSPEEADYLQKLGKMVEKEETEIENIDAGKLVSMGKALEKKLEALTKERKLGHLLSAEDSDLLTTLGKFVEKGMENIRMKKSSN